MTCSYISLSLFGFTVYFVAFSVAREAIVGGEIAQVDQFPYQVSLQIDNKHICGGGIIGDKDILTSAQCIVENLDRIYNRVTILARTNSLHNHGPEGLRVQVTKAYVPTNYHRHARAPTGDIAVLKLKEHLPTTYRGSLQKARVVKSRNDDHGYTEGIVAGFGWTWNNMRDNTRVGNNTDGRLRFAHAHLVDCISELGNARYICAKLRQLPQSVPPGTCVGDTGDLLIADDKTVIGVLSVGPRNCRNDQTPAVYTRAAHYYTFIRNSKENRKTKHMNEYILSS